MATKKENIETQEKIQVIIWNGSLALVQEYIEQGYDARLATPEELQIKILENQAFLEAVK